MISQICLGCRCEPNTSCTWMVIWNIAYRPFNQWFHQPGSSSSWNNNSLTTNFSLTWNPQDFILSAKLLQWVWTRFEHVLNTIWTCSEHDLNMFKFCRIGNEKQNIQTKILIRNNIKYIQINILLLKKGDKRIWLKKYE